MVVSLQCIQVSRDTCSAASTIRRLKKFIWTGLVNSEKPKKKCHLLMEEKLDIAKRLEHTPQKSVRRLMQEKVISKNSAGTLTK